MSLLEIDHLSHSFGEKVIFHQASFRLQVGEHLGLVGANGQGKTTFLKLITKEILPEEGTILWAPKVNVGYMDQNVALVHYNTVRKMLESAFEWLFQMEDRLNGLYEQMGDLSVDQTKIMKECSRLQDLLEQNEFYQIPSNVEKVARGLGIFELLDQNPQTLSGGQRTKIILAKLLLEQPDVLLLDEPTNHLDEENIEWLRQYLNNYKKAFILISHDTAFMNDCCRVIYDLRNKTLTRYVGNYKQYLHLYKEREQAMMSAYAKQQDTIERLETYIQKNKVRAATAAMAKSREKQLAKIERIQLDKKLPIPHFDFRYGNDPYKKILETKNLVIGYDKPLTKPLNLLVERGDKIVLTGANGIGKSTLMKSLLRKLRPLSGNVTIEEHVQIGYYEQELSELPDETVLEFMWGLFPKCVNKEVRAMLARSGLRTEHIQSAFSKLSGGEQSRARLCEVVNKQSNVLFLDEPTNHLDKEAKEVLKQALIAYPGTVIFVTHEKEFYQGLATKVWDCRKFLVPAQR